MALKIATGLRNAMFARNSRAKSLMSAATISFGDGTGTGGNDQILDSGDGLAGYVVGDFVTTTSTSTTNDGYYKILAVAAGALEVAAGSFTTESAVTAGTVILAASENGGSLDEVLRNGVLDIYSGSAPSTADAVETGTKLCRITLGSGAFVAGAAANGLNFDEDAIAAGVIAKTSAVWSGVNLATGTAGYYRFYSNAATAGDSATAERIQGTVGTSGTDLVLASVSLTSGATTTIDTFSYSLPASA